MEYIGILEVIYENTWHNTCQLYFNEVAGEIACKQLNLGKYISYTSGDCLKDDFQLLNINCQIEQDKLNDCEQDQSLNLVCNKNQCVKITCAGPDQGNKPSKIQQYQACQKDICQSPYLQLKSPEDKQLECYQTNECKQKENSTINISKCNEQCLQEITQGELTNKHFYEQYIACENACLDQNELFLKVDIVNTNTDDVEEKNKKKEKKIEPLLIIIVSICIALILFIYITYRQSQQRQNEMKQLGKQSKDIETQKDTLRQYKQEQINQFHSVYQQIEDEDQMVRSVQFSESPLGPGSAYNITGSQMISSKKSNLRKEFRYMTPEGSPYKISDSKPMITSKFADVMVDRDTENTDTITDLKVRKFSSSIDPASQLLEQYPQETYKSPLVGIQNTLVVEDPQEYDTKDSENLQINNKQKSCEQQDYRNYSTITPNQTICTLEERQQLSLDIHNSLFHDIEFSGQKSNNSKLTKDSSLYLERLKYFSNEHSKNIALQKFTEPNADSELPDLPSSIQSIK